MLEQYLLVAEGLKPQGLDGALKCRVYMDSADDIVSLRELYKKEGQTYTAMRVDKAAVRDGFAYLSLAGVSSREDAGRLRGAMFYMARKDAPPLPEGRYYICDLIGCEVRDDRGGMVGTVCDVMQPGANDVYVLRGGHGEVLIPVVPELVIRTDVEARLIVVRAERLAEVAVFED